MRFPRGSLSILLLPLTLLSVACGDTDASPPPAYPPPPPPAPVDPGIPYSQPVNTEPPPAEPPPPPSAPPPTAPPTAAAAPSAPSADADAPANQAPPDQTQWEQAAPGGRWVYSAEDGWLWVPEGATTVDDEGTPYVYMYSRPYGWTWYVSPWGVGPYHYGGWVARPWHPRVWRPGVSVRVAHPYVVRRLPSRGGRRR